MNQFQRLAVAFVLMCAVFVGGEAFAANQAVIAPGPWKLYEGSRIVRDSLPSEAACVTAATERAPRLYTCRTITSVSVVAVPPPPPDPVPPREWLLSGWSVWQTTMTSACVSGSQSISQVRTRTVLTAGDGAQPVLSEDRVLAQTCITPPANAHIAAPPAVGHSDFRVRSTGDRGSPAGDGVGAFRLTCGYSHMAFDDPIVFPGQPGRSHLHTFFGNGGTDGNSTTQSLLSEQTSTCAGGLANRSAYWVPSLIDTSTNRALVPSDAIWYYKRGYNANPASAIQAMPNGLRIIAGKSPTASASDPDWQWDKPIRFYCNDNGNHGAISETIPVCRVGSSLEIMLVFPNCWDGVNLDSVDHRSHMKASGGGRCPASHPVALPELTLNYGYRIAADVDPSKLRLASDTYSTAVPAGYSLHADVWFAWDEQIRDAWLNNCVRASVDCHAFLLGDGRTLY